MKEKEEAEEAEDPPLPPDSAYRICYKMAPPKVGILIQNTISKFSKTKN